MDEIINLFYNKIEGIYESRWHIEEFLTQEFSMPTKWQIIYSPSSKTMVGTPLPLVSESASMIELKVNNTTGETIDGIITTIAFINFNNVSLRIHLELQEDNTKVKITVFSNFHNRELFQAIMVPMN